MSKKILLLLVAALFFGLSAFAQDKEELKNKEDLNKLDENWNIGGGIGLNLDQLIIINPRAGAGDNKFGFGGIGNLFATYKKERFVWDNIGSLQLVFQRLGRKVAGGFNPYQKTIDDLRLATKPGYALTADEKWYAALEVTFQSQVLKTYENNFLSDVASLDGNPISQFFSPATITITPGIDWKPNENLSVLFSPASMRLLVVANDDIADDAVFDNTGAFVGSRHGNPMTYDAVTGNVDFDNLDFQLGASIRGTYKNTFLNDRISFATMLYVFYNYLGDKPNFPVVDWTTETGFNIYKGLSLQLTTGLYYDYNKLVSKDYDQDTGTFLKTGQHGAMFTEALLLKYNHVFGAKKKLAK